ncbi:histidine kinase [Halobacillus litoralis]|uniref:ATP-binding protein n=1 Tax=Halobacillus litoralis TaxID=45668 RepID=UPI001CD39D4C|nr:ATP-binding protein [Halobacillus litoralis]MCA0971757.1 histidine kinase [Halobacillus litoralis]
MKLKWKVEWNDRHLLHVFRIVSIVLSFVVHMFWGSGQSSSYLWLAFVLLLSASVIMIWLYEKSSGVPWQFFFLFTIETIGVSYLLIVSGGLNSLFIWYGLNPVLLAANGLPILFGWLYLGFYLFVILSFAVDQTLVAVGAESLYILAIVLITLAVQLLTLMLRKFEEKHNELEEANLQVEQSIDHVMSLYQITERISHYSSKDSVYHTFATYARQLTKSPSAFFYEKLPSHASEEPVVVELSDSSGSEKERIVRAVSGFKRGEVTECMYHTEGNGRHYIMRAVTSGDRVYGILGLEIGSDFRFMNDRLENHLDFLSHLCSVTLDRLFQEEVHTDLLLLEEQNRIANEIHDSVSQRLFSIVYALHSLDKEGIPPSLQTTLNMVEDSSRSAAKELRVCIYNLSKRGDLDKCFSQKLKNHLKQISSLSKTDIAFHFSGEEEQVHPDMKSVLLRLITEATGNAIRHGAAEEIEVEIKVGKENVRLNIVDNGIGFEPEELSDGDRGLGLQNMESLVERYAGSFKIRSETGTGTMIDIQMPKTQRRERIYETIGS